ncbi:MAG: hypothetical protein ACK5JC_09865 [Bacteroidota bacterium]|jgi:hypothetical protein
MKWNCVRFLFLFFLCRNVFPSQAGLPRKNESIEFFTTQSAFSTSLSASSLADVYRGGFLDTNRLLSMSKELSGRNQLFFTEKYGLEYSLDVADAFLNRFKIRWDAGVCQRNLLFTTFTGDAFRLLAFGNQPMKENELSLSGTRFLDLNFQEFFTGFTAVSETESGRFSVRLAGSLLNMKSSSDFQIYRGNMFTDSIGSRIATDISANFRSMPGDTALPSTFFSHRGYGFLGHLSLSYTIKNKFHFALQANDLGTATFYRSSVRSIDTAMVYKGFYIHTYGLLYTPGYTVDTDSLTRAFSRKPGGRYTSYFPSSIIISTSWKPRDTTWQVSLQSTFFPMLSSVFMHQVSLHKTMGVWKYSAGVLQFFGKRYSSTIGVSVKIKKTLFFTLDVISPEVLIIPGSTRSAGIRARARWNLPHRIKRKA